MAKGDFHVLRATLAHVEDMRGRMREADEAECRASSGNPAIEEALRGFHKSLACFAVIYKGRTICVFGVVAYSPLMHKGVPWALGTEEMREAWLPFAKHSRAYVEKVIRPFDVLENYVDVRNTLSVKWLKWCGFEFDEPKAYGVAGLPFRRFWLKKQGASNV